MQRPLRGGDEGGKRGVFVYGWLLMLSLSDPIAARARPAVARTGRRVMTVARYKGFSHTSVHVEAPPRLLVP